MKNILGKIVVLFIISSSFCLAGKKGGDSDDAPDTQNTVTAITPGTDPGTGTITIAGNDTPFKVDSNTTILVDGNTATLTDVHEGMQVLSQTTPDSSAPEIDLKTVAESAAPAKKGKKKKGGGGGGGGDSGGGDSGGGGE
jgi:hypothetical protein